MILVNNAAWATYDQGLTVSPENLQRSFAVNVFGPLYLIQSVVPHMPSGGRIINIGTIASKLGLTGMGLYSPSKAALDSLTFMLAKEVSVYNIEPLWNVMYTNPGLGDSSDETVKASPSTLSPPDLLLRIQYHQFQKLKLSKIG
jgi:NAD(P)-dependent dehydrogenase (short-subunit alcohol dehydrogenase family)